ncbi:MAG: TonB-dependent receptor [Pyrinomonadaceae bacterium]|nr:TonB-dependent receptor [Sphingobacteriaceae bacterium]
MRNNLKRILLSCVLIFIFPFFSVSQECSHIIFGSVKNLKDGSILPGASIKILELNRLALAEDDSHYHFNGLCKGKYTLHFSFVGYQDKLITINITKPATEINIYLIAEAEQLSEVEVTTSSNSKKPLQIQSKLQQKDLENTHGQSLGELLKTIPGLSSIQTGPSISKPVIHGMHSNRILIYNVGVRQEGQQWGSEHAPEIDPFLANQITVIKGAASVMYGADAMGGVIMIEPAPLKYEKGLQGRVNLVGMSNNGSGVFSGMIEGSHGSNQYLSWRVQGTLKVAGNSKTADYYMKNTAFNERNGTLTLGYRKHAFNSKIHVSNYSTKLGIFSGAHIGSTTDLLNAIALTEPLSENQSTLSYHIHRPYQNIQHRIFKIKSGYVIKNLGSINAQYSYQQNNREEFDVVREAKENTYQLKFDLTTQSADLYLDHEYLYGMRGRIGINGIFQQNFYSGRFLIPFFNNHSAGAYLIENWSKNNFTLEAGIRYDMKQMKARLRENVNDNSSPEIQPQFSFNQLSGTFGAAYNFNTSCKITTTVAKAWRPPAINELFSNGVHHGSATFEKGDRNLKEESSINLTTGISKTEGKLTGEASVYLYSIKNYIYLKPDFEPILTVRGAFPSFRYVQVPARFSGLDVMAAYQLNSILNTTIKYSLVGAYNTTINQHLEFIPADKISAMGSLRFPGKKLLKDCSIDLTGNHSLRQWRVSALQDFAPTPKAYTLFNIDLSALISINNHETRVSVSCLNVFNTSYRDYLNRFRYYSDDVGRNIIIRLQVPFTNN